MTDNQSEDSLPLSGIRVVEFTHMVMGPTVGLILADLGADVIKVEPLGGDNTRRLKGSGAGYFPMYNRNKRSISIDLKSEQGLEIVMRLVAKADVAIENFRPGAMEKLGLGYDAISRLNPGIVYCSEKGFLAGPYENRTALDEVAQMMGGLAYMTGPSGRPLRAGASVIDVTGGMFGAIGIMAALLQRQTTGKGQYVKSSLFETTAFLVGQHMAQFAVTGIEASPMPERTSAWAVYDVFETGDGEKVFVGVVSDTQWKVFCEAFAFTDWSTDEELAKNNGRVSRREEIIPALREHFQKFSKPELMQKLDATGLPFAPISKPVDLFDDPHLNDSDGLTTITLPDTGEQTRLPTLPIEMAGKRMTLRSDIPRIAEHTKAILAEAGYGTSAVESMIEQGVVQTEQEQRAS